MFSWLFGSRKEFDKLTSNGRVETQRDVEVAFGAFLLVQNFAVFEGVVVAENEVAARVQADTRNEIDTRADVIVAQKILLNT